MQLIFLAQFAFAQKIVFDKNHSFDKPLADSVIWVNVYLKESRPRNYFNLTVLDLNQGTANNGSDYIVDNPLRHRTRFNYLDSFPLIIKSNSRKTPGDQTIVLLVKAISEDTTISGQLSITLREKKGTGNTAKKNSAKPKKEFETDTAHVSLSILTAGSFDFFGNSQFTKYAGELNAYMPDIWFNRLGLNAGISHLHYYTADSSSGKIYTSNVLLDPTTTQFTSTTKYKAATYALNSKTDQRTWSYYLEPIFRFGELNPDKKRIARLFLTGHFEVFTAQATTTYIVDSLQNIELTFDKNRDSLKVFSTKPIRPKQIVNTTVDGYFGIGPTLIVDYPNRFSFNATFITGYTTGYPQLEAQEALQTTRSGNPVLVHGLAVRDRNIWNGFYFGRASIVEKYTKLNGTIGFNVRGFYPVYTPRIAAYLGFQLKLEDFFKK